jgi:molybdenum cofactor cytidylyltransferase
MIFGRVATGKAAGALLAHGVRAGALSLKKGRLLTPEDITALLAAGIDEVMIARLEPGDVPEDEAASLIAHSLAGDGLEVSAPFTGRANLFAARQGLVLTDPEQLSALNRIDEAITIACLAPFALAEPRQMVATVKIIPFALPRASLERFIARAREGSPVLALRPFTPHRAALILTRLGEGRDKLDDKTVAVTRARLERFASHLDAVISCDHEEAAIARAIEDAAGRGCAPILLFGASAIVDRRDVIPAGIARAGGVIEHFGMPVDPGNLLLLAKRDERVIIGLPGCARSPKLNGFDWVLQRVLAGLPVTERDISAMGSGGLLKEVTGRPFPRDPGKKPARPPRFAAVLLAAGQSRRMGADNKLLADIGGKPMVARVADTLCAARLERIIVVTGFEADRVAAALAGRNLTLVHNPDYDEGLSTSLRAGIAALDDIDAALVCLGDMPLIRPEHINRLIAAFDDDEGRAICVPTTRNKRGNPVLWSARFFGEMKALTGDIGARHLIGEHSDVVCEVPIDDDAIFVDVDTRAALAALDHPASDE